MQLLSREWVVVIISASTDALLVWVTALQAAMMASGNAELPTLPVFIVTILGAAAAFARTIQQALRGNQLNRQGGVRT